MCAGAELGKDGSFAEGALAGALAEITGSTLGNCGLSKSKQIALQNLIGTAAVLLAGDDVENAAQPAPSPLQLIRTTTN